MANFNTPYLTEREGQMEFFDNYGIPYNNDATILVDNTDGVYNGNIFEFKLAINNLNKTLFQAIKYLSKMRVRGESVPATIILVDLNATTVYVYKSKDYRADIQTVYTGAASKNNDGFVAGSYSQKLNYSDIVESNKVRHLLKSKKNPDDIYIYLLTLMRTVSSAGQNDITVRNRTQVKGIFLVMTQEQQLRLREKLENRDILRDSLTLIQVRPMRNLNISWTA